jgi:hypothetical protein
MAKGEERELKQSFPRELLDQPSSARLDYFKAYTAAHPFLEKANAKGPSENKVITLVEV